MNLLLFFQSRMKNSESNILEVDKNIYLLEYKIGNDFLIMFIMNYYYY